MTGGKRGTWGLSALVMANMYSWIANKIMDIKDPAEKCYVHRGDEIKNQYSYSYLLASNRGHRCCKLIEKLS